MNNLLTKFDNIEVNNNTRISSADQMFCEDQERQYKEFLTFADDYIVYLNYNSLTNVFIRSEHLIDEMHKTKENEKLQFIHNIVDYFRDKYKVTLNSDPIQKKYNYDLTYNIIVNEIIEQLGGYNFTDKAEKEIKDEFKDTLRYNKMKVKNNKISMDDYFYLDHWDVKYKRYRVSYGSDDKFYKLFKALSHFMFKSNDCYFNNTYRIITQEENEKVFTTHHLLNNGIETIKLYKNGKIDLQFSSNEFAQQFAKEYCGYMPDQKSA